MQGSFQSTYILRPISYRGSRRPFFDTVNYPAFKVANCALLLAKLAAPLSCTVYLASVYLFILVLFLLCFRQPQQTPPPQLMAVDLILQARQLRQPHRRRPRQSLREPRKPPQRLPANRVCMSRAVIPEPVNSLWDLSISMQMENTKKSDFPRSLQLELEREVVLFC